MKYCFNLILIILLPENQIKIKDFFVEALLICYYKHYKIWMLYKNYIVNKMNLIILFVFMLSENEAFLISDRFNYKYDIIQDIFVYENIDLCTNYIFITFMHENVEKYGYLNRNKEIIDDNKRLIV